MVRYRSHRGAFLGFTLFLAALVAPCAEAATVSVSGSTLTFTAAAGETNDVDIVYDGTSASVVDRNVAPTPGAGCHVVSPNWVMCDATLDTFNVTMGDGDDYILLWAFPGNHATINGGSGADTIRDHQDTADVQGGPGNDDIMDGGGGGDSLKGGADNDTVWGGGEDGSIDGQGGADVMGGGNVDYSARTNPVTVTADEVADDGEAGENDNVFEGATIIGGLGADHLTLVTAASVHGGPGNDVLHGGEQDDWLDGGAGADQMDGEGGTDYADYRSRTNPVNVTLGDGLANEGEAGENDQLLDMEGVFGGSGNDNLSGGNGDEHFWPNAGNDSVTGGGGDDVLNWSAGVDSMAGGAGTDTASFLFTTSVTASIDGVANDGHPGENDNIATDVENLEGSPENDVLIGSDSANLFDPSYGDDQVSGLGGNDTLVASPGADSFDGGPGDDTANDHWDPGNAMDGGDGDDTLSCDGSASGGPGNDNVTGSGLVEGGDGSDDLFGLGDDELIGGPGADSLHGQGGADNLVGGMGNDNLDGASSSNTWADYSDHSADVRVDLVAGKGGAQGESDTFQGVFNVRGGSGDDVLLGNGNFNMLAGGPGADLMKGRGGNQDLVTYEDSALPIRADLEGSARNDGAASEHDTIADDVERLRGGDAGDMLRGSSGRDTVLGGPGNDTLRTSDGADSLSGGEGNDKLFGERGNDNLAGDEGNDLLVADPGDDSYDGGAGDDLVRSAEDEPGDFVNGGDGTDTIDFAGRKRQVSITLGGFGTFGLETVIGTKYGDRLVGTAGEETFRGGGGNDFLDGKGGADVLDGQGGSGDQVWYGSRTGAVTVDLDGSPGDDGEAGEGDTVSAGVEQVVAGSGDDQLVGNTAANFFRGGPGADSISGAGGKDVVDYSDHAAAVDLDLSDPGPQGSFGEGDTLDSIEGAIGGPMGDTLVGTGDDNWFRGGPGADEIAGHGGFDTVDYSDHKKRVFVFVDNAANDGAKDEHDFVPADIEKFVGSREDDVFLTGTGKQVLEGGKGDDILDGWTGDDVYRGGKGFDYVAYFGRGGSVHADLDGHSDDGVGGEKDIVSGDVEGLAGGNGNDALRGNRRSNGLAGGPGNDQLTGAGGHDGLFGDAGADTLYARDGLADFVHGGAGNDRAFIDAGLDIIRATEILARSTIDHLPALSLSALRSERSELVGAWLHDPHLRLGNLVPRARKIAERL
jgi:Ca2+-binding RTX toxin-like protein